MIEPTIEALTTSCSPWPSAKRAMISSGALPKVTLSRPPIPGPERAASSSVARPISAAVGMIPSAEAAKTIAGRGAGELEHHRDRDQRRQQVGPALRRAQEGGVEPGRLDVGRRRRAWHVASVRVAACCGQLALLRRLAHFCRSAGGLALLQAFEVAPVSAASPSRSRRPEELRRPRSDAADAAFEQPPERRRWAAFEQFERVDAELLEQLFERLRRRPGRRSSCSSLTPPSESSRSTSTFSLAVLRSRSSTSAATLRMMSSSPT